MDEDDLVFEECPRGCDAGIEYAHGQGFICECMEALGPPGYVPHDCGGDE